MDTQQDTQISQENNKQTTPDPKLLGHKLPPQSISDEVSWMMEEIKDPRYWKERVETSKNLMDQVTQENESLELEVEMLRGIQANYIQDIRRLIDAGVIPDDEDQEDQDNDDREHEQ